MVSVNPLTKEIQLKVVYYGPGLGGKTTTLQHIHDTTDEGHRGKLVSLATPVERTLYFDYLPVTLPKVGNYTLKLQLFTVPGQIHFNATRKLVLSNADGVVFVADSQRSRMDANMESLDNLYANLVEYKIDVHQFPILFQYNKRDLDDIDSIETLDGVLNKEARPFIDTCAIRGDNVYKGLELITKAVLRDLKRRNVLGQENRLSQKHVSLGGIGRLSDGSPKGKGVMSSPLEDAVSKIMEDKTGTNRRYPGLSRSLPAQSIGGDRPTIPAPFALTEKTAKEAESYTVDEKPFSFLPFWPDPAKERAGEIENAISDGRRSDAMHLITAELNLIVSVHRRGMVNTSPNTVVAMLGLDDQHYRAIREQAALADDALTDRMVLGAYLFLLMAVDRSR
jgi:mutual gliding-motility protein MglA